AGTTGQEQQAPIGDQVGIDDPREVCLAEVQVALDRWQRDVHDRRVEDDHELPETNHDEGQPAPPIGSKCRRMNFHNASTDEPTYVTITITGSLPYLLHGLSGEWE